jgi:hypothetical protein
MTKTELFLRHARRLRDKANKARRLAVAVAPDELAKRFTTFAFVWETKSVRAERCAVLAAVRARQPPPIIGNH